MRFLIMVCATGLCACGFPRPVDVGPDESGGCTASQALRCESDQLVRCDDDGIAERKDNCALGCNGTELRCNDVTPSNGLAPFLEMAGGEGHVDLGTTATINTDDGVVQVDGTRIMVRSTVISQASAPGIRILIVGSLVVNDVTVTGGNAVAIVSADDLIVNGIFNVSATQTERTPGAFNDNNCRGNDGLQELAMYPGAGGGGFGGRGGNGGSTTNENGTVAGGAGGMPTGNPELIPLRGGCSSGGFFHHDSFVGAAGGAVQLVSRTKITVLGAVAANGASFAAGGSGGAIMLEAPEVNVSGSIVANGGGGAGGCILPLPAEHGRLDAQPASGSKACTLDGGGGGGGGARDVNASNGANVSGLPSNTRAVFGGSGGGGVGRIRVNTFPGGLRTSGVFSPNPSTGTLSIQ